MREAGGLVEFSAATYATMKKKKKIKIIQGVSMAISQRDCFL